MGFWPSAICSDDVSGLIKTIHYIVDKVGIDYVALGSDFDGNVPTPFDVSHIQAVTQALLENNFSQSQIRKIMGENVLNLFSRTLPD